jgi:hypothetical protein
MLPTPARPWQPYAAHGPVQSLGVPARRWRLTKCRIRSAYAISGTVMRADQEATQAWESLFPRGLAASWPAPPCLAISSRLGQSYNRYAYVRNDPVNRVDPTGYEDEHGSSCGGCPPPPGPVVQIPTGTPSGGSSSGPMIYNHRAEGQSRPPKRTPGTGGKMQNRKARDDRRCAEPA